MARSGVVGKSLELLDGPCGLPWDDLGNHCFCYKSQLIITFPPLGLHLEFPYVDFQISMKIIENHKKGFASNAIWTSIFQILFSYAAWKTIWSQYINENCVLHKNTCPFNVLPQTLSCLYSNEIGGFGHRSNISQGTAGPSSGVPFHSLSDPGNIQNAYYVSSRAILEKPRFSHVDRRVAMKITVLPLWVTLNGL